MTRLGFKIAFMQVRGPFLILSIVLVAIGVSAASKTASIDWINVFLLLIGVILAHISVNLFNEASDYKTEIDSNTKRTPFSGGSGLLQAGETSIHHVRFAAFASIFVAAIIGVYFVFTAGLPIAILMLIGGFSIIFYTDFLARYFLGELFAGLSLGSLVVIGVYYALTSQINFQIVLTAIPPGLLTALLLFLNELPDVEADRTGGRRHLVILLGKKRSVLFYITGLIFTYGFIAACVILGKVPAAVSISLITSVFAVKASQISIKHFDCVDKMIPALGLNVLVVILTDLLIAVGYLI